MPDQTLAQVLRRVGFDGKEAAVYLALLETGRATAAEVAARAELKRPIVYHILERLIRQGFASEQPGAAVKRFAAEDPSLVLRNARGAVDDLASLLPLMRALQSRGRRKPRIEFFDTKSAIESVYRTFENGRDARYLTSMARLHEHVPEALRDWFRRCERGVATAKVRQLVPSSPDERTWAAKARALGQQVRFLPSGAAVDMDFAIVDEALAITSFDPLFIVVIRSEKIAASASLLFDLAWKQAGAARPKAIDGRKR